jgi:hypothetical protein
MKKHFLAVIAMTTSMFPAVVSAQPQTSTPTSVDLLLTHMTPEQQMYAVLIVRACETGIVLGYRSHVKPESPFHRPLADGTMLPTSRQDFEKYAGGVSLECFVRVASTDGSPLQDLFKKLGSATAP